jgi:uncharacterized protein with gpF-like domain
VIEATTPRSSRVPMTAALRRLQRDTWRTVRAALDELRASLLGRLADAVRLDPLIATPGTMGSGRLEPVHVERLGRLADVLLDRWATQFEFTLAAAVRTAARLGQRAADVAVSVALRRAALREARDEEQDTAVIRALALSDIADEVAEDISRLFVPDLIRGITTETRTKIGRVIRQGVLSQTPPLELMSRIRQILGGATRARAEAILRTELSRVFSAANDARARQLSGEVEGLQKRWVAVMDSRTRDAHREVHLATLSTPIPIGARFRVGGEWLRYPLDPAGSAWNTVNCRCTAVVVVDADGVRIKRAA